MRQLENALLVTHGAGEGALDVAEQLCLEQGFGEGTAIDRHERQLAIGVAASVQGAGDFFLADPGIACDQDRTCRPGQLRQHGFNSAHGAGYAERVIPMPVGGRRVGRAAQALQNA